LEVEFRTRTADELSELVQQLVASAEEAGSKIGCSIDVSLERPFAGYEHAPEHLARRVGVAALEDLGIAAGEISSAGGSDANAFELMGIPSLNFGDGSLGTHTDSERIAQVDLESLTQLVMALPGAISRI
jgi:tripeptide aminopeptidase